MSCINCDNSAEHYMYSEEHGCDIMYRTCEKRHDAPVDDDETCKYDTSRKIVAKEPKKLTSEIHTTVGDFLTYLYDKSEDILSNATMHGWSEYNKGFQDGINHLRKYILSDLQSENCDLKELEENHGKINSES